MVIRNTLTTKDEGIRLAGRVPADGPQTQYQNPAGLKEERNGQR